MSESLQVLLLALLAGAAIPVGGWLASIERIHPNWLESELRHSIIAFGAGCLLSAVALVLVPKGMELLSIFPVMITFFAGGIAFMALDVLLYKSGTSSSQMVAMLADFLPETIVLGAVFISDPKAAMLLACIIALQNLPEGFNSFRELQSSRNLTTKKLLAYFVLLALLGPVAAMTGYTLLDDHMEFVGALMLFAGGGILYITIQDIAPQAVLKKHWAPPLGAVCGFLVGMIGHMMVS